MAIIILAAGIAASLWFARRTAAPSTSSVPRAAVTPAPTPDARLLEQAAPEDRNVVLDTQNTAESSPTATAESPPPDELDKSQLRKEERAELRAGRDQKSASQMSDEKAANPNSFGKGAVSASTSKTDSKSTDPSLPVEAKTVAERKPNSDGDCMMSVSESSLSIRNGGSGTVTVNLNGRSSPAGISASTSDWSNIVVLTQPQGGKGSGSTKYSIVSVSKNTGTYAVNFKSPCGTKSVMVTVK
jgi:hypothetical protein